MVVLIGGLDGSGASRVPLSTRFRGTNHLRQIRRAFKLIAIPSPNPERNALSFLLRVAYRENAESHVLWRWIGVMRRIRVRCRWQDFGLCRRWRRTLSPVSADPGDARRRHGRTC